ncbi:MAG: hypothetical protein ACR2OM_10480 [Aestuariivirgaceae bacterium]
MAESALRPGRPIWLELNAQRVTSAIQFYQVLFGWTSRPLHVHPWGSIPNIVNGERMLGNQFMAMGGFAAPRWIIWFSADLDRAEVQIKRLGGDVGQGIHQLGNLGLVLNATDPQGHPFSLINPHGDPPQSDQCGDPCLAEFWGPNAAETADFYAEVINLKCVKTDKGAMLTDQDVPRLFLRDTDFDIHPPRWIPYFRSSSTGGDHERARRAGAVLQVYQETVPQLGDLVVLSDPAGACFGIVNTDKA